MEMKGCVSKYTIKIKKISRKNRETQSKYDKYYIFQKLFTFTEKFIYYFYFSFPCKEKKIHTDLSLER